MEKSGQQPSPKEFKVFFWLLNSGIILSFFLSALWVEPPMIYYILGAAGAILQAVAFYRFFLILKNPWKSLQQRMAPFNVLLLKIVGVLLAGKVLLQLLTGLPYFASLSFIYTDFVIGYLHWVFLGVVSIALFALLNHFSLLKLPKPVFWIYFTGFVLSEILIFYKGTSIWLKLPFFIQYFTILVLVSLLMALAVGILLGNNILFSKRKK